MGLLENEFGERTPHVRFSPKRTIWVCPGTRNMLCFPFGVPLTPQNGVPSKKDTSIYCYILARTSHVWTLRVGTSKVVDRDPGSGGICQGQPKLPDFPKSDEFTRKASILSQEDLPELRALVFGWYLGCFLLPLVQWKTPTSLGKMQQRYLLGKMKKMFDWLECRRLAVESLAVN